MGGGHTYTGVPQMHQKVAFWSKSEDFSGFRTRRQFKVLKTCFLTPTTNFRAGPGHELHVKNRFHHDRSRCLGYLGRKSTICCENEKTVFCISFGHICLRLPLQNSTISTQISMTSTWNTTKRVLSMPFVTRTGAKMHCGGEKTRCAVPK